MKFSPPTAHDNIFFLAAAVLDSATFGSESEVFAIIEKTLKKASESEGRSEWTFLGRRVCLKCFKALHGVGVSARMGIIAGKQTPSTAKQVVS